MATTVQIELQAVQIHQYKYEDLNRYLNLLDDRKDDLESLHYQLLKIPTLEFWPNLKKFYMRYLKKSITWH